jgi:hypothetical protein
MFTQLEVPLSYPGTDIPVAAVSYRILARGDDRSMWQVEYWSEWTNKWHPVAPASALEVLRQIEASQPLDWEDIKAAA